MRTRVPAACLISLLLIMAAGCSKPNDGEPIASVGGSSTPSATSSLSPQEQGIRYAHCMRQHGVPMPDPGPDGDLRPVAGGKDALGDALRTAQDACRQYQPVLSGPDGDLLLAKAREESRCMRAHGVENFPDPDTSGHAEVAPPVHDDPQYEQARTACTQYIRSYSPTPAANRS